MGRRGKSARKAAYAARAAARRAAEEELRAAVEREGDARRQAAHSVAKAFVKQFRSHPKGVRRPRSARLLQASTATTGAKSTRHTASAKQSINRSDANASRAVDIRAHYLRSKCATNAIKLHYIPTGDQVADALEKPPSPHTVIIPTQWVFYIH